jgi:U6 snRNA-associated Sm-like protein LSm1
MISYVKLLQIIIYSTFDQYSTIVLSNCVERHIVGTCYCDEPIGLHIIRGETIVLLGQVKSIKMQPVNGVTYKAVSLKEILEMERQEQLTKKNPKNDFDDFYNFW